MDIIQQFGFQHNIKSGEVRKMFKKTNPTTGLKQFQFAKIYQSSSYQPTVEYDKEIVQYC